MIMKRVLVVNELSKDIFSEYLLGAGLSVERLTLKAIMERLTQTIGSSEIKPFSERKVPEIILTVNHKIEEAVKIKGWLPDRRVIAVSGGRKDFSAFMSVVYGAHDYDNFSFRNMAEFKDQLFSSAPRPQKSLSYTYSNDSGINYYEINPKKLVSQPKEANFQLAAFMAAMVFLSGHYLDWLADWAKQAAYLVFPVSFSFKRDKKIKSTIIRVKNEYLDLPVFNEGSRLSFWKEGGGQEAFEAVVTKANDSEISVALPHLMSRKSLKTITSFKIQPSYLEKRIENWQEKLEWFRQVVQQKAQLSSGLNKTSNSLGEFLAGCEYQPNFNEAIFLRNFLGLNRNTERVLRDPSQIDALIKFLGPEFINLIIGPAATGKTFLTSVAIQQLVQQRHKIVLAVSHTNVAVDRLLSEAAKHLEVESVFRLGNDLSAIDESALPFHRESRHRRGFFGLDAANMTSADAEKDFLRERAKIGVLIGCTLDSYQTFQPLLHDLGIKPNVIIVDEASRGFFFELLPVILAATEKVVFVGDNNQLGSIDLPESVLLYLQSKIDALAADHPLKTMSLPKPLVYYFNRGFFNSLVEREFLPVSLLKINRRSLSNISDLGSQVFYNGQLIPGRFNPYNQGRIIFYDTKNVSFRDSLAGTSKYNSLEAAYLVKEFIKEAVREVLQGGKITNLVCISPYAAQVGLSKEKMRKHLLFHKVLREQANPENIEALLNNLVITVDSIQGGQRKNVWVSLVRSNEKKDIGFNHDLRRLCVTFTRAEDNLVIVGDSSTFLECDYPEIRTAFKKIIEFIKARGIYREVKINIQEKISV